MRDTSLNQGTQHSERLMRCDCKRISAKKEVQNTKQFPLCSHLFQLRAIETAFLYSTHSLLSRGDLTIPEKNKCHGWGKKSLLLSYRKSPDYTPNPHPESLSRHTFASYSEPLPVAFLIPPPNLESISGREKAGIFFFFPDFIEAEFTVKMLDK